MRSAATTTGATNIVRCQTCIRLKAPKLYCLSDLIRFPVYRHRPPNLTIAGGTPAAATDVVPGQ